MTDHIEGNVLSSAGPDLDRRATAIGIRPHGWPYGPNIDMHARTALLAWAERRHLRLSRGRCLRWLTAGRCNNSTNCPGHHSNNGVTTPHWLDHVTGWTRNGSPAVLLAQPYGITDDDLTHLAAVAADPALTVTVGGLGWYGNGTIAVDVWRCDAGWGIPS